MKCAESIFFRNTSNREWLARKSSQQDIMFWYILRIHFGNIAIYWMIITKIFTISCLGIAIPFTRK